MAHTRVIPTSIGMADFNYFENLKAGDLFLDAEGIGEHDASTIAEAAESHIVWMRTETKQTPHSVATAVSLESGRVTTFKPLNKVILLYQRNMWELWT